MLLAIVTAWSAATTPSYAVATLHSFIGKCIAEMENGKVTGMRELVPSVNNFADNSISYSVHNSHNTLSFIGVART